MFNVKHPIHIWGVPEKVNLFFVQDFLGHNKTEFIEILHIVILKYDIINVWIIS